jgi:hypothetical protein
MYSAQLQYGREGDGEADLESSFRTAYEAKSSGCGWKISPGHPKLAIRVTGAERRNERGKETGKLCRGVPGEFLESFGFF